MRSPWVKTAVPFDFVKAGGTIGNIYVDKSIGQAGSGASIEAQSIGTIYAGDDITLYKIQSDNGDIQAVSGVNVTLTQSITAIGGDVRLVTASKISGNIIAVAKVTPGPVPAVHGGNIWLVQSTKALTNQITADGYIGAINVIGITGVATKAQITAQGGAKFNPVTGAATPQALVVNVGTDPFEGSVKFTYSPRVAGVPSYLASYANGAPLFTLTDKAHPGPAGQTWKVTAGAGAAGSVNVQNVLFTWLGAAAGLTTQDFTQNGSAVTNWSVQ